MSDLFLLDMTKAGLKEKKVLIIVSAEQIVDDITSSTYVSKEILKEVVHALGEAYNNLPYIYNHRLDSTKQIWSDFCHDCLLYCLYRKHLYGIALPITPYIC